MAAQSESAHRPARPAPLANAQRSTVAPALGGGTGARLNARPAVVALRAVAEMLSNARPIRRPVAVPVVQRVVIGATALTDNRVAKSHGGPHFDDDFTLGSAQYKGHMHANNYFSNAVAGHVAHDLTSMTATFWIDGYNTRYHVTRATNAAGAWSTTLNQGPTAAVRADMVTELIARIAAVGG